MTKKDLVLGVVKNALIEANNCVFAPEGACPAYMAIKKLTTEYDIQDQAIDRVLDRCRLCPAVATHPCPASQLILEPLRPTAA